MLRSLKQMCGKQLEAQDGKVGNVQDFYIDDQKWAVRYVVAHTGSWLTDRLVSIASQAFRQGFQNGDRLLVDLTKEQIQNSPEIAPSDAVSREYEEVYFHYYGWLSYWNRDGISENSGLPVVTPPDLKPDVQTIDNCSTDKENDHHLRSAKSLRNYHIESSEGGIGHLVDLIMDEETWEIRQLIVDTGHWQSGKEIAISPAQIHHMNYEESKIFVTMSREAIKDAPEFEGVGTDAACHAART